MCKPVAHPGKKRGAFTFLPPHSGLQKTKIIIFSTVFFPKLPVEDILGSEEFKIRGGVKVFLKAAFHFSILHPGGLSGASELDKAEILGTELGASSLLGPGLECKLYCALS